MLQIAGKPVENVEKAMDMVLEKIKTSSDFKFLDCEKIEAELDEESTLYSGILDVGLKFENAEKLLGFIVDYTPNSVEIEDPQTIKFDCASFNSILNDMSSAFLKMQMQVRQANAGLHYLNNKVKELEAAKK